MEVSGGGSKSPRLLRTEVALFCLFVVRRGSWVCRQTNVLISEHEIVSEAKQ
jgi:hypothetical protein